MDREKLQLALGIMSGRIVAIRGRKQFEMLGLQYESDYAHYKYSTGFGWRNILRRHAEDILLEAFCEHS